MAIFQGELEFSTSCSWNNNKVYNTVNCSLSPVPFLASHFIAICGCQTVRYVRDAEIIL